MQQSQRTAAVGRVVRNSDFSAFRNIIQGFDFLGINAHRLDMYLACGYKIHLALGNEGIQIRLMLEEVGIQLLIIQSQVRFYIIAEFDNLQVYALFSQGAFDLV